MAALLKLTEDMDLRPAVLDLLFIMANTEASKYRDGTWSAKHLSQSLLQLHAETRLLSMLSECKALCDNYICFCQ